MNNPTMTKAGAVAAAGINVNKGAKNKDNRNIPAVDRAVSPVRPPAATPDADSTNVVIVDVPREAPAIVPIASAVNAFSTLGNFPSSSSISALDATPASVPTVSKISTIKGKYYNQHIPRKISLKPTT
jgi:hypothetical protein